MGTAFPNAYDRQRRKMKASFAPVKVADVKTGVKEHLPSTLASKRLLAFREPKPRRKPKTCNPQTAAARGAESSRVSGMLSG